MIRIPVPEINSMYTLCYYLFVHRTRQEDSVITAQNEAATEDLRDFPNGRCGDPPQIAGDGCGVALNRDEADNGACSSYPDCVLL